MKKVILLITVVVLSTFLWSCGNSGSKDKESKNTEEQLKLSNQNVKKQESNLPEGYPTELTVPPGFRDSQIRPGSGSSFGMGGDRTFKSFEIWKMNPNNAPELISHYKKLTTDLGYEGKWKGDGVNESARGTFKKGQNELELSISSEQFKFYLKVWDEETSE